MGIWGDIGDVLRGNMSKTGIDRNKQKTSISNIPSHPLIPPSYTAFRVGTNLADAALVRFPCGLAAGRGKYFFKAHCLGDLAEIVTLRKAFLDVILPR